MALGGRAVDGTETGWGRPAEPAPRWRALLDRALLGGRTGEQAEVADRRGEDRRSRSGRERSRGDGFTGRASAGNSGQGGFPAEPQQPHGPEPHDWATPQPERGAPEAGYPGESRYSLLENGYPHQSPAPATYPTESRYAALEPGYVPPAYPEESRYAALDPNYVPPAYQSESRYAALEQGTEPRYPAPEPRYAGLEPAPEPRYGGLESPVVEPRYAGLEPAPESRYGGLESPVVEPRYAGLEPAPEPRYGGLESPVVEPRYAGLEPAPEPHYPALDIGTGSRYAALEPGYVPPVAQAPAVDHPVARASATPVLPGLTSSAPVPARPATAPGTGLVGRAQTTGRATPDNRYAAPRRWRDDRTESETDRAVSVLRRSLGPPRVLAFANPKGGVHKTTATVLAAATIGSVRGRGVLAWDDNELRGTLGLRAGSARHARTIRHLVSDLVRIENSTDSELLDRLDDYLRHASDGSYDVLAGEESPRFASRLDKHTVSRVLEVLRRTHDVICVDTGNNVESVNWRTVLSAADQLVVTTVPREDAAFTADWMLDLLHEEGMGELVENAVTLLSCPTPGRSPLLDDLERHFATRTRAVAVVPYDPALESGASIEYGYLQQDTREAWLRAASVMVEPFAR
jgi:MinD-like ATPase involved in chromosome partitioning or flagellar assembly